MIKQNVLFIDGREHDATEVRARTSFYISENGAKHIDAADNRQLLKCEYGTELVKQDGTWRVKTEQDTLNELKNLLKNDINSERDKRIYAGIEVEGKRFQTDKDSLINIMGAFSEATSLDEDEAKTYVEDWITEDNQFIKLNQKQVITLGRAAKAHKSKQIGTAGVYKKRLEQTKTIEEAQVVFDEYVTKLEL